MHRDPPPPDAARGDRSGRAIEKYTPMFFEDPLRPNSFDAMAWVADHIPIPVATGERFISLYQFQTLLSRHAVQYLRPDVCLCGGITGAKKIAALAEAHDAGSCRTIRCHRSAPRRVCKSRPASRTSRSRSIRRARRNSMVAKNCSAMISRPGFPNMRGDSSGSRTHLGSASNSFPTSRSGFHTSRGQSECGRTLMAP